MSFGMEVICFHGDLCCWRVAALFVSSRRLCGNGKILPKQPFSLASKNCFIIIIFKFFSGKLLSLLVRSGRSGPQWAWWLFAPPPSWEPPLPHSPRR